MIIIKIIGIVAFVVFAGMCMWISLRSSILNLGEKDDYDKH